MRHKTEQEMFEGDLAYLVGKYQNISGKDFQRITQRTLDGYFTDHLPLVSLEEEERSARTTLAKLVRRKLQETN